VRVLVGFEVSGKVRRAFSKRHDAWSCDLQPADDNSAQHYRGDFTEIVERQTWDLIIMHPPCTALAVSGNRWYGRGMPKHTERLTAIKQTMDWFELAKSVCSKVCMENPVGVLPLKATQYIQPWQHGHGETKKTGLWLHGLEKLRPSNIVEGREQLIWYMSPGPERSKKRSETYQGIADAFVAQWGA